MTCKDCLHFKVCEFEGVYFEDVAIKNSSPNADVRDLCPLFDNKADLVEAKRGKWLKRGNEKGCSECEFIYYSNNDDWTYCPNCGAKMDGGKG